MLASLFVSVCFDCNVEIKTCEASSLIDEVRTTIDKVLYVEDYEMEMLALPSSGQGIGLDE